MMTSSLMMDLVRDRQRDLIAEAARHRLAVRGRAGRAGRGSRTGCTSNSTRTTKKWFADRT